MNDRLPLTTDAPVTDATDLAHLGEGVVAYVKPMASEDITRLFPDAPALQPGLRLFALLSASGEPILLAGSRDVAVANAKANDLTPVSLH